MSDKKLTNSQIMRLAIQDLWLKAGSPGEFEDYYNKVMTRMINKLKAKLDD